MNIHVVLKPAVGGEFAVAYVTHVSVMKLLVFTEETQCHVLATKSTSNRVVTNSAFVLRHETVSLEY